MTDQTDNRFWEVTSGDVIAQAVEDDVYNAISQLLDPSDSDHFLLWFVRADTERRDLYLQLLVEGINRPDIARRFYLTDIVGDALDGWKGGDGINHIHPNDLEKLTILQKALEAEAKRVQDFIVSARGGDTECWGDDT